MSLMYPSASTVRGQAGFSSLVPRLAFTLRSHRRVELDAMWLEERPGRAFVGNDIVRRPGSVPRAGRWRPGPASTAVLSIRGVVTNPLPRQARVSPRTPQRRQAEYVRPRQVSSIVAAGRGYGARKEALRRRAGTPRADLRHPECSRVVVWPVSA